MSMIDPTRRTLLRTAGAIAGSLTFGTVTASEDDEQTQSKCHDNRGRISTLRCDQTSAKDHGPCDWASSALTVHNCAPCEQEFSFRVNDGGVSTEDRLSPSEVERLPTRDSFYVQPGEKVTVWFTGRVTQLNVDYNDMNIAISQRVAEGDYSACEHECNTC